MKLKKTKNIIFFIILITNIYIPKSSNAQFEGKTSIYLAPRLTLGYTLNSGFNYGIDLNVGLYKINFADFYINSGLSVSAYYVNFSVVNQIVASANILLENDYFNAKTGYGYLMYKWGYNNVNRQFADALNFDLSISSPDRTIPAIGVKYFNVNPEKRKEFNKGNYISGYMYFRQKEIIFVD